MSGYHRKKKGFNFEDFTITKREILASISIIAVMLLIGILISGSISEYQTDKNEIYNKAIKIESSEIFEYGMRTNVGNAFVYGDLEAVDIVTYPEISGEYMYVKKVKEKYTMHTRTVTTTVNGKPKTRVETYWSWDYAGHEALACEKIRFLGVIFDSNKINIPSEDYIDTIKESSHIRYKYYGTPTKHTGTVFTELRDSTILDNSSFYANMTIEDTIKRLESRFYPILFWIGWTLLIVVCVFGFYYLDNDWLE